MTSVVTRLGTLFLALSLVACGGGDVPTDPVDPATAVARVNVTAARTSLVPGATLQLSADAVNTAGTILVGKRIDWVSSRPDVATITSLGLVTGVGTGTTVITATSSGQSGSVTLTVQAPNQIILTSDAGDYIGGGATYFYTNANAIINVTATATAINVGVAGNQGWNAHFSAPLGMQLGKGTFSPATRWPFQGSGAGLDWSGDGRGCNTLTGLFVIDSLLWNGATATTLLGLDMHFEQHCEGAGAALRGTIHWRADDLSVGTGPTAIPANLWQPPATVVPGTGNYAYLQSDAGDYIGQGATTLYQTNVVASGSGRRVTASAGGYSGTFQGMNSLTELKAGYYGNLQRWPFNNPVLGGLDWSGNGRGCNTLSGWFVIDRINFVNGTLAGVELRFEQHCEGMAPAMHGAVRWGQFAS